MKANAEVLLGHSRPKNLLGFGAILENNLPDLVDKLLKLPKFLHNKSKPLRKLSYLFSMGH